MQKIFKLILMLLTHIVTNIFFEAFLWTMILWFHDTSILYFVLYISFDLALLFADYRINGIILRRANLDLKFKWLIHLPDLIFDLLIVILVIPNIGTPEIKVIVFGLIMNALLASERIFLIKAHKKTGDGRKQGTVSVKPKGAE